MKKLLLLLCVLLLQCPAVRAELTVIEDFSDGETCAMLIERSDGTRVFTGIASGDERSEVISAPLPAGTEMYTEDEEYYGLVTLGFYHPTRGETPWVEVGVAWQDGTWQVTDVMINRGELIRFEEGCITSDMYDDYHGTFSLPLDVREVDWLGLPLSFREAMTLMDTTGYEMLNEGWSAFEEDYVHIPDAEAAAFCAEQLPGYAIYDGRAFEEAALLLADDAQGVRYFFGCVKDGDAWRITRSTPLPEGATCETFHAAPDFLRIWLPLPRERQNVRYGEMRLRCTVCLTADGQWEVQVLNPTDGGVMSFETNAILEDTGNVYYGDYDLPLDVTMIDWMTLPASYTEALSLLDASGWVIVAEELAPLYAAASQDSALLGRFHTGAPMRLLQQEDGWAQVSPIGGAVTGWMPLSSLLPGEEQAVWNDEYRCWSSRYAAPRCDLSGDVRVYRTAHDPESAAGYHFDWYVWGDAPGLCAEGCCQYVYSDAYGLCGYIPFTGEEADR